MESATIAIDASIDAGLASTIIAADDGILFFTSACVNIY